MLTKKNKEMDRMDKKPLFYPDVEPAKLGQKIKPKKQKTIRATLKKVDKIKQDKMNRIWMNLLICNEWR
jgi:hypothetical protein